jgi:hypothetical protein
MPPKVVEQGFVVTSEDSDWVTKHSHEVLARRHETHCKTPFSRRIERKDARATSWQSVQKSVNSLRTLLCTFVPLI